MAQTTYRVVFKDASGNQYETEKTSGLAWERYENEVGRCKVEIPYSDTKLLTGLEDDDQMWEILIYREEVLVWQGFLAFLLDQAETTSVYGLDFKECLKWYDVQYNVTYTDKKIGSEILEPEWNQIAAKTNPVLGAKIKKGTIQNPYTTGTTTEKTITRTVFAEDYFSLLKEMVALARADSPSGSWVQNTVFDISLHETNPTFSFMRNVGSDQAGVVFAFDREIADFYVPKDYRFIRNNITGYSVIAGPKVITSNQVNTTSRTNYYLREFPPLFGQITTQSELDEKVKDFLKETKDPRRDLRLQFGASLAPFDGYVMGDNVQVRINRGRVSIDEYMRVIGMEVTVDDTGTESAHPILQKKRT